MITKSTIEVFQELSLNGAAALDHDKLRDALISCAREPWRFLAEKSQEAEALMFERAVSADIEPAVVAMWRTRDGYRVSNVVPIASGELSYGQYNRIVQAFAEEVATPAANEAGYDVELSAAEQSLSHWL